MSYIFSGAVVFVLGCDLSYLIAVKHVDKLTKFN
jgi:hypothetical protein